WHPAPRSHAAINVDRRTNAGLAFHLRMQGTAFARLCWQQITIHRAAPDAALGRTAMKTLAFAGALSCSLLAATALTPVAPTPATAADRPQERELNVGKEPQNWLLHHGNYEGHRFSQLKLINTDTVKGLKPVFSVALGGFESGGRYKHGNLEGTPL